MRAKITKRLVQSLVFKEKVYEVVDAELAGFILRAQPLGSMDHYLSYSLPDRRRNRVKLGSSRALTLAQARDKACEVLANIAIYRQPACFVESIIREEGRKYNNC